MAKRFKPVGQNLFASDFALEEAVKHCNQHLAKLNHEIDFVNLWQKKLLEVYKGGAEMGSPPYDPILMFKMLFLSYLYGISEREIERVLNDSISMKRFLGLGLMDPAPDHSSLTKFKNRILHFQVWTERSVLKEVFDDIIVLAQEKGVDLGFTLAIDSTHTIANVNTDKERKRTKKLTDGGEGKPPRDSGARWGVKRIETRKTAEGKKVKVNLFYYGYKSHFSVSTDQNIITSYGVTPFNAYDGHSFKPLMDDDIAKGVAVSGSTMYTADRGYDDGELHTWLNQHRFKDAIALKYTKKENNLSSGYPPARWTTYTAQEEFETGLSNRYVVERVNASVKKDHGLGRARYLGLDKMNLQTALCGLAHNLKSLVKLWTGVGLRTPTTAHVS